MNIAHTPSTLARDKQVDRVQLVADPAHWFPVPFLFLILAIIRQSRKLPGRDVGQGIHLEKLLSSSFSSSSSSSAIETKEIKTFSVRQKS